MVHHTRPANPMYKNIIGGKMIAKRIKIKTQTHNGIFSSIPHLYPTNQKKQPTYPHMI